MNTEDYRYALFKLKKISRTTKSNDIFYQIYLPIFYDRN